MIEEAINLIESQKEMYVIQLKNINSIDVQMKATDYIKIRKGLKKDIELRDYILEILNKQKK